MPVIKRYPNRKLYDTLAKQYVTLDGIAEMIRDRQDVQVLDHATGEDLTALTLSQIIFEQQKKNEGFLPHSVLTGLIRAGGDTLKNLRHSLVSSLGLVRFVDEEIERRIDSLVSCGELDSDVGRNLVEKLRSREPVGEKDAWLEESDLEQLLAERGVPTREDLQQIIGQLDTLASKIEQLHQTKEKQ